MSTINVRACDLDGCAARAEVKSPWSDYPSDKPDGWRFFEGKHFCGYEHLIAWAQRELRAELLAKAQQAQTEASTAFGLTDNAKPA